MKRFLFGLLILLGLAGCREGTKIPQGKWNVMALIKNGVFQQIAVSSINFHNDGNEIKISGNMGINSFEGTMTQKNSKLFQNICTTEMAGESDALADYENIFLDILNNADFCKIVGDVLILKASDKNLELRFVHDKEKSVMASLSDSFPMEEYEEAYDQMIDGNHTKAASLFEKLVYSHAEYPEIWYQYGCCLMELRDFDSAGIAFSNAASKYENACLYDDKIGLRNDAMTTLGEMYLMQKDFPKAEDQFEKCFALQNDRDMVVAVAASYIRLGYEAECERYFATKGINLGTLLEN